MRFVGSSSQERVIEFFLAVSGFLFYHLFLRPKDFFSSQKKKRTKLQNPAKKAEEITPSG